MLKIQNEKLIGGSTLTEAYSSLVGTIGSNARAVKSGISSAEIDLQTKYDAKQALSGVDMNEETVNMQMFIQYYQANAQILQTATTMFDSLLSIK
jgi:flagellar hook-associated protein 1 FlgK|nr:flagellar basal body rod C-terminal domain-containing protein [Enterobacter hormaechei]